MIKLLLVGGLSLLIIGCGGAPTPTIPSSHQWVTIIEGGRWVETKRLVDDELGIACYKVLGFGQISCAEIGGTNE